MGLNSGHAVPTTFRGEAPFIPYAQLMGFKGGFAPRGGQAHFRRFTGGLAPLAGLGAQRPHSHRHPNTLPVVYGKKAGIENKPQSTQLAPVGG